MKSALAFFFTLACCAVVALGVQGMMACTPAAQQAAINDVTAVGNEAAKVQQGLKSGCTLAEVALGAVDPAAEGTVDVACLLGVELDSALATFAARGVQAEVVGVRLDDAGGATHAIIRCHLGRPPSDAGADAPRDAGLQ